jgi:prevent-host-death family protein
MAAAMGKNIEIGAYEAKTHLPRLLREVAAGKSFTITVRGKPVAELAPMPPSNAANIDFHDRVRAFHAKNKLPPLSRDELKSLKDEGRD